VLSYVHFPPKQTVAVAFHSKASNEHSLERRQSVGQKVAANSTTCPKSLCSQQLSV
jgi:hypothetical protein